MTVVPKNDVLRWEIANIAVEVRCRETQVPEAWKGLFPAFTVRHFGTREPDILLDAEPVVDWENPHRPPPEQSVWWATRTAEGVHLEGSDYSGVLRPNGAIARGDFVVNSAAPSSLAGAVRSVLNQRLVGRGMLLHASGVVRNRRLWLFAGYARAGKTTIARKLNDGGVPFSVDRVALLREGQQIQAHPTPFSDPGSVVERCAPAAPAAVLIVKQGNRHALDRLAPASAACMLIHHAAWSWQSRQVMSAALEVAGWLAEHLPVYTMTFTKDVGFWRLLDTIARDRDVAPGGDFR
jgi:hypothetical protein